jgi:hypothetical protein
VRPRHTWSHLVTPDQHELMMFLLDDLAQCSSVGSRRGSCLLGGFLLVALVACLRQCFRQYRLPGSTECKVVQATRQYRLPCSTGGQTVQVAMQYRWSDSTGCHAVQLVRQYRLPCSTGGQTVQVARQYRWSDSTGCQAVQVVS